ncbi:hypothetical protein AB0A76_33725 [Streptomyces exfoliatus]|uniref:Uncharacterized protein n=1 Tax=Streptomyces exfoliatus TaxID=1905 RepID=A0ABV3D6K3_STREX
MQSLTVFGEMPRFNFPPGLTSVVNEMASLHNYAGLKPSSP